MENKMGVLPVLKPAGMTSHDVVARVRKILGTKKVGHTGTLDPQVVGVLPVLVGSATRLSDYFMNVPKEYSAVAFLGYSTTTEDATGEVLEKGTVFPEDLTEDAVRKAVKSFVGEREQIPPDYSATKIGGKKFLDYVRKGEEIPKKKSKHITVYDMIFKNFDAPRVHFDIVCSKGTYVRTICAELGENLGTMAHMESLVRTVSGGFRLDDTIAIEEVTWDSLIPISKAVLGIPMQRIVLPKTPNLLKRLDNGIKFDVREYALKNHPYSNLELENTGEETNKSVGGFLFVEDTFYGILDEKFQLSKKIVDTML